MIKAILLLEINPKIETYMYINMLITFLLDAVNQKSVLKLMIKVSSTNYLVML